MSVNNTLENLTVRDSSLNLRCESLICNNVITPSTPQKTQIVSQTVSPSTTVDCGTNPSRYVIINTQNMTTSAGSATTFTFQNTNIEASSIVLASIIQYNGSVVFNGNPVLLVKNISAGSCSISVMNCQLSNAFNSSFKIYVEIIEFQSYP